MVESHRSIKSPGALVHGIVRLPSHSDVNEFVS
jgi:hypothetical protein